MPQKCDELPNHCPQGYSSVRIRNVGVRFGIFPITPNLNQFWNKSVGKKKSVPSLMSQLIASRRCHNFQQSIADSRGLKKAECQMPYDQQGICICYVSNWSPPGGFTERDDSVYFSGNQESRQLHDDTGTTGSLPHTVPSVPQFA